jgi:hypothetical protein
MTVHPAGKTLPWRLSSLDLKKKPPKTGRTVKFWPLGRCTMFGVGAIALAHGTVSSRCRVRELVRLWVLLKWVTTCEVFITGSALPFGSGQRCQGLQQVSALTVCSQRRIGQCTGRLLRRISGRVHRFCGGWRKKTLQLLRIVDVCCSRLMTPRLTHPTKQCAMSSPPLATASARGPSKPRPRISRLQ